MDYAGEILALALLPALFSRAGARDKVSVLLRPLRLLLPVLALLACAAPGHAATLNVPTTAYPTIQAAVTAAAAGDTVVVADGTYSGAGNRDIDFGGKSLTVRSASGDPARTIIDCGGQAPNGSGTYRGFYLHSGETAAISGFTIQNGRTAGVPVDSNSAAILTGCALTPVGPGVFNSGMMLLTDCTFSGNHIFPYYPNIGGGGGLQRRHADADELQHERRRRRSGRPGRRAVQRQRGTATLNGCTVADNAAYWVRTAAAAASTTPARSR